MSIKKTRKIAVLALTLTLLALSGITAFASAHTYSIYLPIFQGHITLVGGDDAKKSDRDSTAASNEISELGNGNNYAMCWVDNKTSGGTTQATPRTQCRFKTKRWLAYTGGFEWTGRVELRAYASNWGVKTTLIEGDVNFG